jgi:hypothetical protein
LYSGTDYLKKGVELVSSEIFESFTQSNARLDVDVDKQSSCFDPNVTNRGS